MTSTPTSSYFEVDPFDVPEDDDLRKQGFSKDKRPDLVQVVIGLAVTRQGILIRSHTKAVCRLRTHPTYGKYLRQRKDGTLKLGKQAIRNAEKYDDKYLIRTSDYTLSAEDVYKQPVDVEDGFRALKTTLKLRPMY